MKGFFYTKQYVKCKSLYETLEPMIENFKEKKMDIFIKMKSRIMVYRLVLHFINNELDDAIEAVMDMIKYISKFHINSFEA